MRRQKLGLSRAWVVEFVVLPLATIAYVALWPALAAVLELSDNQAAALILFGALLVIPMIVVGFRVGRPKDQRRQ
ncbi:MAG: hypothetical protein M4D85_04710 [Actinomycetota bacterium]|nr:hypothetical protein [Actinomycetota bacterium]